jgi:hypothetical protein
VTQGSDIDGDYIMKLQDRMCSNGTFKDSCVRVQSTIKRRSLAGAGIKVLASDIVFMFLGGNHRSSSRVAPQEPAAQLLMEPGSTCDRDMDARALQHVRWPLAAAS